MAEQQQTLSLQQALDLALQHHSAGRLSDAESIYQQILRSDPNQPIALHLLGVIAHQRGKNDVAVDLITKALTVKPDYAEAHNNLGNALQDLGKPEEALASCHKALAIKPDFAEAHNNLGNALQELGQLDEAVASYHKALATKPDFAEAHNNLGVVLRHLGKLDEAVASYHKALALKPDYAEAHNNLGNALQDLGKQEEAVASYRKALDLKPDYPEAHNNLGNALQELGKLEEAIISYREALGFNPDHAETHYSLSVVLQDLGKRVEAAATLLGAAKHLLGKSSGKILLKNHDHTIQTLYLNNTRVPAHFLVKAFIENCCETITRMLDRREFDIAGEKIRGLYMLVIFDETFNALVQRYFDSVNNEKFSEILGVHERATHLSMQSQYFYQNGQYDKAEECARRCVNKTKILLEDETHCNDGWLLVKKSLKNIKNSARARRLLEQLLLTVIK